MGKVRKTTAVDNRDCPISILIFFILSAGCVGLHFDWLACGAAIILIVILLKQTEDGIIQIPFGTTFWAVISVPIIFLLSPLWAIDHGMTIYGFFKTLPLVLFWLCISQCGEGCREKLFCLVPAIGVGMTLLSWPLSLIPSLEQFFTVNHRLAGFFQYPNTFAALLLCGMAILLFDKTYKKFTFLQIALLFCGILLSGSRTAFLLTLGLILSCFFWQKDRTTRLKMAAYVLVMALAVGVYAFCRGGRIATTRFLTIFSNSSTFFGRILYVRDAFPVVLRHPLGLGYLGYRFLQGSFQTGVYSVTYVHNELVQLLLDVGWFPAVLWIVAIGKTLLSNSCTAQKRALILVLCLHSLFDFDFQYPFMCFILLLSLEPDRIIRKFRLNRMAETISTIGLCAVCAFFAVCAVLYSNGAAEKAVKVYPGYTLAWIDLLPKQENIGEMEKVADKILALNDSVSLAHSAKARAAFSFGNIRYMIEHKEKAISLSPYVLEEYLDYFDMLEYSIQLYQRDGNSESVKYCREKLLSIPAMLSESEERTSDLGWRIQDKPDLALPQHYATRLKMFSD